jgi:hypothetical protein
MGNTRQPEGQRSKFTPTGNEQGSTAVQPDDQDDTPDSRQSIGSGQRGSEADEMQEEEHHGQQEDAPGIFSALVGDGKEP